MKQFKYALLLLLLLRPGMAAADIATADDHARPVLRFCYEDKELLPYYAGNSSQVPPHPGASIEHLRSAAKAAGVQLQLVRLPWLRCLQQLEDNQADALIAAFDESRAHYTVFPQDAAGKPDPLRAMNQLGLCLAHRYDNPLPEKLTNADTPFSIARPLGYRAIALPPNSLKVEAHSPQHALELVVSGRVDATTVLCQLNGMEAKEQYLETLPVQLHFPPLHQSYGYLMFSTAFYRQHPQHAEQLWLALPQTLEQTRYLHYLQLYPK